MTNDVHESFLPDDDDDSSSPEQAADPLPQPEEVEFQHYGFSFKDTLTKYAPYLAGVVLLLSIIVGGWYVVTSPQGGACDSPYDCRSGLCLSSTINSDYAFCADSCYTNEDCPDAHICFEQGSERVCVPQPSLANGETCHFSFDCISQECLVEGTTTGYQEFGYGYNYSMPSVTYNSYGTCVEEGTTADRQAEARKAREAQRELQKELQKNLENLRKMREMNQPNTF